MNGQTIRILNVQVLFVSSSFLGFLKFLFYVYVCVPACMLSACHTCMQQIKRGRQTSRIGLPCGYESPCGLGLSPDLL